MVIHIKNKVILRTVLICFFALNLCACASSELGSPLRFFQSGVWHEVRYQGETLTLISAWYTGNSNNWKAIASENPRINERHIALGDKIFIPRKMIKRFEKLPVELVRFRYEGQNGSTGSIQNVTAPASALPTSAGSSTLMSSDSMSLGESRTNEIIKLQDAQTLESTQEKQLPSVKPTVDQSSTGEEASVTPKSKVAKPKKRNPGREPKDQEANEGEDLATPKPVDDLAKKPKPQATKIPAQIRQGTMSRDQYLESILAD